MSAEARELTGGEKTAIRKLVTGSCANYDSAYGCLPLDCECYMLEKCWTSAYCQYFTESVLPLNPLLMATLTGAAEPDMKKCAICGDPIYGTHNRVKYCGSCAERVRRNRQREYMQKKNADI